MKNITFRAEESLIERARLVAREQHRTLNAAFREWLEGYGARAGSGAAVDDLNAPASTHSVIRPLQTGRDGRAMTLLHGREIEPASGSVSL